MPRFECVSGHRGSAKSLVVREDADISIGNRVSNACPDCGKDVTIVPCNKHAKKPVLANLRSGDEAFRRPFAIEAVGAK